MTFPSISCTKRGVTCKKNYIYIEVAIWHICNWTEIRVGKKEDLRSTKAKGDDCTDERLTSFKAGSYKGRMRAPHYIYWLLATTSVVSKRRGV